MQNESIEAINQVTQVLEKLNIPYLIGGSLASALYGMVRTTRGADIVAIMQPEHLQPFVLALQDEFYVDNEMIAESIQHHSCFNIIHRESMFEVDIFIPHSPPFCNLNWLALKSNPFILNQKPAQNLAVLKRNTPNKALHRAVMERSGIAAGKASRQAQRNM